MSSYAFVAVARLLSHVCLFCSPMDCSPKCSSVHKISRARILAWLAISFSWGSSWPGDQTQVSGSGRWILDHWATRKAPLYPLWGLKIIYLKKLPWSCLFPDWSFSLYMYSSVFSLRCRELLCIFLGFCIASSNLSSQLNEAFTLCLVFPWQ